jgi:uncharacterized protein (DUF4415 family)
MSKIKRSYVPDLTDEEEAQAQAAIAADPDNPELTGEELAAMRPASEALPSALYEALTKRGRGRPPVENPKRAVKLRIDPDVLDAFKATGPGWQTRINDTLRAAAQGGALSRATVAHGAKSAAGSALTQSTGKGRARPAERAATTPKGRREAS